MASRQCSRCGRRYPSSYQRCPYCAGQRRDGQRRRPASLPEQVFAFLRQNNSRIFVGGAAFFLCVAILGMLLTQCGKPKEPEEDPPVRTEQPVKPLGISRTAATLAVGETVTLSAFGGFDTLVWSTSDKTIATVMNGRVMALTPGTVEITASTGGEAVSCTVTVEAPPPVSQPELSLNRSDFTIRPGDSKTFQMKVRIKGTKEDYTGEVVWASQDPAVATVNETGLVERAGRGMTVITATAGGQVMECIVRVR